MRRTPGFIRFVGIVVAGLVATAVVFAIFFLALAYF